MYPEILEGVNDATAQNGCRQGFADEPPVRFTGRDAFDDEPEPCGDGSHRWTDERIMESNALQSAAVDPMELASLADLRHTVADPLRHDRNVVSVEIMQIRFATFDDQGRERVTPRVAVSVQLRSGTFIRGEGETREIALADLVKDNERLRAELRTRQAAEKAGAA